jgi:uncharacterized cupin superfamily protein
MSKIDLDAVPASIGIGYPKQFQAISKDRRRQRLAEAAGLTDFGVQPDPAPAGQLVEPAALAFTRGRVRLRLGG